MEKSTSPIKVKKSDPGSPKPDNFPPTESNLPDAKLDDCLRDNEAALFPIIGIGASAGGVEALQRLFKSLPPDSGNAYAVAVHLAADHPSRLAEVLANTTSMPVVQILEDTAVKPDTAYVIPPNHYMVFDAGLLRLQKLPQPRSMPKAIDRLFISLAEDQQERAICIILTGADHDGTVGLKAIKAAGGMVMAQLPETAQHPSMPESAIDTGLVDYVLPIEEMGSALAQYIARSDLWQRKNEIPKADDIEVLNEIISLLRMGGGGDFRGYKEGMLIRRAKRRMALKGITILGDYAAFLRGNPQEILALGQDFLIKVTEFFREPPAWKALGEEVLPKIVKTLAPEEPLRVWVAACSTGEEAYSVGIALLELISRGGLDLKLNIIGSDLDRAALEFARAGSYPESILTVLKPELLARYFIRADDGRFVVRKRLRESVMFSQHNLIADPPFSHMHLISCRNLLIYLKPEVQDKLLRMFHFALNPEGYLFLGKSETVGESSELFIPVDKQHRIYRSLPVIRKTPVKLPLVPDTSTTRLVGSIMGGEQRRATYAELVRELLLKQRSATAVLIDRDGQALYFYGPTRNLLWQPEGAATQNLLSMVSDEVRAALRAVIHSARQEGKTGEMILSPRPGGEEANRQLRIRAIRAGGENSGLLLITFEYEALSKAPDQATYDAASWARRQLEDDLRTTREDLEASIQALEANNVELRIAHEEALSMNEELQSANEELETSKEELQSVNEELNSVNGDLEQAVGQLQTANDDLANLLASSELPILFLDQELRVKRFTPASRGLFNLIPSDIGRPISDLASPLESRDIVGVAREVQSSRAINETEVRTADGHFYLRRVLPYLVEDRAEGTVISFTPMDGIKRAEDELRESEKRFRTLADSAPVFIWISGLGAKLEFANRRFVNDTGWPVENLLGTRWHGLVHENDLTGYLAACSGAEVAGRGYDQELRMRQANGTYRWMRFVGEPRWDGQRLVGFVGSSIDIQHHKDAEDKLRNADRRKDQFLAILGHELRNPLSPIRNAAQALQFVESGDPRLTWAQETISRQVGHITRLVDDLLDISRLTSGKLALQKETVNMADIVRQSVESTKALVDARKHQLAIAIRDEPLLVRGDPVRLIQIVENLLANSFKFTEPGGKISLEAHREDQELVLSVEDNGIGIPPHALPKIFELFMQEERDVRKSSNGLGIGLALVSQLTSLHGGSVKASSQGPGKGSRFEVRLPLADTETSATPAEATVAEAGKERVLIVDDNVDSADSLAMLLAIFGYQVRAAYDFESAIREAVSFVPHVALLDLSKPQPDGLELAKRFQEMTETQNTILIAFTGYGQPDDLARSRNAGFMHHLVKPVDADAVHKLIKSMRLVDG
ncbi:chemotaxis protein CheB [Nitrosovibrio sp. Nv6]|uniref:chemotaxis protein CheB n=1 Tax=Nitrosovibrio sp. Nv6 TaxID=1855340 RepID=UPI0008B97735|nr:chemotaxis protein CheB [Nitrosovibrio sp. Nv6]SEP41746.1 two-component system, chemotaxis family, CheB/CheR fusion protein [Nitrosovibrio sp. Nv6]